MGAGKTLSGERKYLNEYMRDIRKDLPIGQKRCYPKDCISFYDWKKEKVILTLQG